MKRRWVLLVIAANLIGLTALVFLYPHFMVAPGRLVAAHANLETNCFACHAPFRGAAAERCIACHKVADIGLRRTTGAPIVRAKAVTPFHQGLTSQNCMACHTDHTNPALTPSGRPAFSHALLNAAIRENCTSCHAVPATAVHSGVTAQCMQCHSQDRWKPATFEHTRFFVLDRDHNAACTTCHTTNDRRQYTCYGCHEHTEANIRAKHIKEGIPNFTNCVSCHRSADDEGGEGGGRERGNDD
jgi:Class III cytochrome C family